MASVLTASLLASAATRDAAADANLDCALSALGGRRAPCSGPSPNLTSAYVALGISGALGLVALAIWPRQAEVDGVAAQSWARHGGDASMDGGRRRPSLDPAVEAPRDGH